MNINIITKINEKEYFELSEIIAQTLVSFVDVLKEEGAIQYDTKNYDYPTVKNLLEEEDLIDNAIFDILKKLNILTPYDD